MTDTATETWSVQTGEGKKGRTFPVMGLGLLAPSSGRGKPSRPLWALFACEASALRPTLASIETGHKLQRSSSRHADQLEFPKSHGYATLTQNVGEGIVVCTRYLSAQFVQNPGPLDKSVPVEFVVLPGEDWYRDCGLTDREALLAAEEVLSAGFPSDAPKYLPRTAEGLARWAPLAALVASYLDPRTACPLIPSQGFYLTLLVHLLAKELAVCPSQPLPDRYGYGGNGRDRFEWWCTEGLGYGEPVVVSAEHDALEKVLVAAVSAYVPAE